MSDAINVVTDPTMLTKQPKRPPEGVEAIPSCGSEPPPGPQTATTNQLTGTKLFDLQAPVENDPNELLQHRFLCRKGCLLIVGNTGIGKSSLIMQMMMEWALGRSCMGISPSGPLKSLLIQGENDEQDLAEMRDGICSGMDLTEAEEALLNDRITIYQENQLTGDKFFEQTVDRLLEHHKPDLLWIDPALQYLGGDANSQETVGRMLRINLAGQLEKHNCGGVLVHHTNKSKNEKSRQPSNSAYAAAGSAEFSNWPRSILALQPKTTGIHELNAAKRGGRLRWIAADGKTLVFSKFIKHSDAIGVIRWEEDTDNIAMPGYAKTEGEYQKDDENAVMLHVPAEGQIEKKVLADRVNNAGMGRNRVDEAIKRLIIKQTLQEAKVKRKTGPAKVCVLRNPETATSCPVQPSSCTIKEDTVTQTFIPIPPAITSITATETKTGSMDAGVTKTTTSTKPKPVTSQSPAPTPTDSQATVNVPEYADDVGGC